MYGVFLDEYKSLSKSYYCFTKSDNVSITFEFDFRKMNVDFLHPVIEICKVNIF